MELILPIPQFGTQAGHQRSVLELTAPLNDRLALEYLGHHANGLKNDRRAEIGPLDLEPLKLDHTLDAIAKNENKLPPPVINSTLAKLTSTSPTQTSTSASSLLNATPSTTSSSSLAPTMGEVEEKLSPPGSNSTIVRELALKSTSILSGPRCVSSLSTAPSFQLKEFQGKNLGLKLDDNEDEKRKQEQLAVAEQKLNNCRCEFGSIKFYLRAKCIKDQFVDVPRKYLYSSRKGIERNHAKWSPATTLTFRHEPGIHFNEGMTKVLSLEEETSVVESRPTKAFGINPHTQNVKVVDLVADTNDGKVQCHVADIDTLWMGSIQALRDEGFIEFLQKRGKKPELGPYGQHNVLQVLLNNFEHHQCLTGYILKPHQAIKPLFALLDSNSTTIQKTLVEFVSYLLLEEPYELGSDSMIQQVILIPIMQLRALKGLVCIALMWLNEIAKEDGCRVYLEVHTAVLVCLLDLTSENTVTGLDEKNILMRLLKGDFGIDDTLNKLVVARAEVKKAQARSQVEMSVTNISTYLGSMNITSPGSGLVDHSVHQLIKNKNDWIIYHIRGAANSQNHNKSHLHDILVGEISLKDKEMNYARVITVQSDFFKETLVDGVEILEGSNGCNSGGSVGSYLKRVGSCASRAPFFPP